MAVPLAGFGHRHLRPGNLPGRGMAVAVPHCVDSERCFLEEAPSAHPGTANHSDIDVGSLAKPPFRNSHRLGTLAYRDRPSVRGAKRAQTGLRELDARAPRFSVRTASTMEEL